MYPVQPFWVKGPITRKGPVTPSGSLRLGSATAISLNWASAAKASKSLGCWHRRQKLKQVDHDLGLQVGRVGQLGSSCRLSWSSVRL